MKIQYLIANICTKTGYGIRISKMTSQTFYIGDCLELMREYDDDYFDLIIADPPYGINIAARGIVGRSNEAKITQFTPMNWDRERVGKEYFVEMLRVSKNQIIFGGNYYTDYLPPTPCWIVWDKQNATSRFADCELAWTSFTSAVRLFKYRCAGMLQGNMKKRETRIHPTQKPTPLYVWIMKKYSKPGELILDPFLGSGTALQAGREADRDVMGFEISEEWVKYYDKRSKKNTPTLDSYF